MTINNVPCLNFWEAWGVWLQLPSNNMFYTPLLTLLGLLGTRRSAQFCCSNSQVAGGFRSNGAPMCPLASSRHLFSAVIWLTGRISLSEPSSSHLTRAYWCSGRPSQMQMPTRSWTITSSPTCQGTLHGKGHPGMPEMKNRVYPQIAIK